MNLARVIGTCVCSVKAETLRGQRLLALQPLNFDMQEEGRPLIAVDIVRAGRGELVLFVRSREAANSLEEPFSPVDAAIVAIVDDLGMSTAVGEPGASSLTWLRGGSKGARS